MKSHITKNGGVRNGKAKTEASAYSRCYSAFRGRLDSLLFRQKAEKKTKMSTDQALAVSELLKENWGLSNPVADANIMWPIDAVRCYWDYSGKRTITDSRLQREAQASKLTHLVANVTYSSRKNLLST